MRKYNIVAIGVVVSICLLYLGAFAIYGYRQTAKFDYLSDDTLVIVDNTGFTQSEKGKVQATAGIDQVDFISQLKRPIKSIGNSQNTIVQFQVLQIPQFITDYFDIELIAGEMITEDNQLLVSQTLAKTLVEYNFIDQTVVGQKLNIDEVYTIAGVYEDPKGLREFEYIEDDGSEVLTYKEVLSGSAIGLGYQPLDVNVAISNYNEVQMSSASNIKNAETQATVDGIEGDYDTLVAAGATGLLNPYLSYGESFDRLAFIDLQEQADVDYVIDQLSAPNNDAIVISNDSNIYQYEDIGIKFILLMLTSLVLILVYSFPLFLKKRK